MSSSPHSTSDLAAAYALGTLSPEESRVFEDHLSRGCANCAAELASFEEVTALIGLSTRNETPSIAVRSRLLEAIVEGERESCTAGWPPPSQTLLSIRADQGSWKEVQPGMLIKCLFVDEVNQYTTSLVRMLPGTRLPMHRHKGVEQFFVLEGDCHVHDEVLGPGDYHRAEAGSIHESTYTESGTLFLLIAPPDYEIIKVH
jgi:anti-sigma factor ChrR (cupin superfamily)